MYIGFLLSQSLTLVPQFRRWNRSSGRYAVRTTKSNMTKEGVVCSKLLTLAATRELDPATTMVGNDPGSPLFL